MNRPSRGLGRNAFSILRRALADRWRGHEDGITMTIFAVALLILLAMVALGIDGSRLYDERREAQNAADHSAIAAAFASCTNTSTDPVVLNAAAQAAGLASAALNGYDDNPADEVTITVVGAVENHEYRAEIQTTIPTTFARVIGFNDLDTHGEATALASGCDETGGSVPAVHAGGTNCPGGSLNNVQISGNDHRVNGMTRTNGNFYISGNDSIFSNPGHHAVEYRGTLWDGSFTPPYLNDYIDDTFDTNAVEPWPAGWDPTANMTDTMWNAYRSVRVNASATQQIFNITTDGVYYTERASGDIEVQSIANNAQFVVVSKFRPIKIPNSHSGRVFHAYASNPAGTPPLAMFVSGFSHAQPCDQFALERSGDGGTWNGVFWTPRAMSRWSGPGSTINGGFVTWAFQMNGNFITINGGNGEAAQEPDVVIVE